MTPLKIFMGILLVVVPDLSITRCSSERYKAERRLKMDTDITRKSKRSTKNLSGSYVQKYGILSKNKPTKQSSILGLGYSKYAVDGDLQRTHNHCAQTNRAENNWWEVDLQEISNVLLVVIFNMGESVPRNRLSNIELKTKYDKNSGYSVCARYPHRTNGPQALTLLCKRWATFVRIQMKQRNFLTLCEVQVYGFLYRKVVIQGSKVSLYRETSSSTYILGLGAFRANDESYETQFSSQDEDNPWWQIDLYNVYQIDTIVIFNRPTYYISHFEIDAMKPGGKFVQCVNFPKESLTYEAVYLSCSEETARYLKVKKNFKNSQGRLQLYEFEVYGFLRTKTELKAKQ